jgi:hypothetical protein
VLDGIAYAVSGEVIYGTIGAGISVVPGAAESSLVAVFDVESLMFPNAVASLRFYSSVMSDVLFCRSQMLAMLDNAKWN